MGFDTPAGYYPKFIANLYNKIIKPFEVQPDIKPAENDVNSVLYFPNIKIIEKYFLVDELDYYTYYTYTGRRPGNPGPDILGLAVGAVFTGV